MMQCIISWAAPLPNFCLASLDVTAAFRNLPTGHIVVIRPPTILYKLNLLPPGHVWLVHEATYGLREAPSLGSEERTKALKKLAWNLWWGELPYFCHRSIDPCVSLSASGLFGIILHLRII